MIDFTEIAILELAWRLVPDHDLIEHIDLMVLEGDETENR